MKLISKYLIGKNITLTNGKQVPLHNLRGSKSLGLGLWSKDGNTYVNTNKQDPTMAGTTIYSAKDKEGNPVRDMNNKLITGKTLEEAQLNFNNALRDNSDLRYKYMTPSKGIGTVTHSDINNNIVNPAFLAMGTAYENTIGKVPVVSDVMDFTSNLLSLPQWAGTLRSGKAPWNSENRGFNEYEMFNMNDSGDILNNYGNMVSMFTGPKALKGTGKSGHQYIQGVEKRGAETAMRTTRAPNPLPEMKETLKTMGPTRAFHIGNYILTGHRTGPKGYYNSLARFESNSHPNTFVGKVKNFLHPEGDSYAYSGFLNIGYRETSLMGNDIIDTFLYGKEPDPKFGLKRVPTEYGIHSDYIKNKYPNKDIPVYEVENAALPPAKNVLTTKIIGENGDHIEFKPLHSSYVLNTAGHLKLYGLDGRTGRVVSRRLDIWKFNPEDYTKKWINSNEMNKFTQWLIQKGLKKVDQLGTPVITRTRWRMDFSE